MVRLFQALGSSGRAKNSGERGKNSSPSCVFFSHSRAVFALSQLPRAWNRLAERRRLPTIAVCSLALIHQSKIFKSDYLQTSTKHRLMKKKKTDCSYFFPNTAFLGRSMQRDWALLPVRLNFLKN